MRKKMRWFVSVPLAAIVLFASAASAQSLGSAQNFAVLGATTVTNTGASVVTGDLGVSPGTSITGFPPGVVVGGTINAGNMRAATAQADAHLAYAALKALPCPSVNNLTGQDLGTLTLPPGVYCFNSSAQLTGTLVLTGSGPWVFQIASTLTTASNSHVVMMDATNCGNVFWQIGSSATLGTGTQFAGNILALASVTLTTGVNVSGSVIALTAAVTMDTNHVAVCSKGSTFPPVEKCEVPPKKHHHHHHDKDHDRDHHKDKDHKDHDKDHKDEHKDKDHDKDKKKY